MPTSDQIDLVKEHLASAQTILIIFSSQAKFDFAAAAATLYKGLSQMGKHALFLSPESPADQVLGLYGIEKVSTEVGNQNLQMSFAYQAEKVEKVSYHIDEESQKFYLIIQPKSGTPPLDSSNVEFAYTGAAADVIFLFGVNRLTELEQLYIGYEDLYSTATTISINTFETEFGSIKLTPAGYSSVSEMMVEFLPQIGVELDDQLSTNLLAGIEEATDSFRLANATPETFETVAKLLKNGGVRPVRSSMSRPQYSPKTLPGQSGNGFAAALATANKKGDSEVAPDHRPTHVPLSPPVSNDQPKKKPKQPNFENMPPMEGGGGRG